MLIVQVPREYAPLSLLHPEKFVSSASVKGLVIIGNEPIQLTRRQPRSKMYSDENCAWGCN
jgi:hypothetical protein